MSYTIRDFWIPRLKTGTPISTPLILPGWSVEPEKNAAFVEADLKLRSGYENISSSIWLVAAPGAVGKSTLAKEISAQTGAVYLDLAKAQTVAGNYLSGGLVKNNLFNSWNSQDVNILIDALDEAHLRVTPKSYDDFLSDIETLAKGRKCPTVMFGRVGIIEETWLLLLEHGIECPIFDIDFFDRPRAIQFVMSALDRLAKKNADADDKALHTRLNSHRSVYEKATEDVIEDIEKVSASDDKRFAGYAPVLEAIAIFLADESNPATLNDVVRKKIQGPLLQQLIERILEREAIKLRNQLPGSIPPSIKESLYKPEEQLDRLSSLILATAPLPPPKILHPQYIPLYEDAVRDFMSQHPFLDGKGQQPSGSVFAAAIIADALFSSSEPTRNAAEKHAGYGPNTPNPFLSDFYLYRVRHNREQDLEIPPEHIVFFYESIRSRSAVGDIVRLSIEGDEKSITNDVEIQISTEDDFSASRYINFTTNKSGELRFGRRVNGVSIDAPQLDAIIGSGSSVELIAPIYINIDNLIIDCSELIVLKREDSGEKQGEGDTVIVEANNLLHSRLDKFPVIRPGVEFSVSWPGASSYPWTSFAASFNKENGGDVNRALLSLSRLILAFRSHSKGQLARLKDKIEHARMAKGFGNLLRLRMLKEKILIAKGNMYILDPNALGKIVGANYQDLKMRRFNESVQEYVESTISQQ